MTKSFFAPGGLILGSALFFCASLFLAKPELQKRTQYVAPPIEIKYLSAGFNVAMSDSFWIRAVQDMDYCEEKVNENECRGQSWMFHILNLVTELDPKFELSYFYGGLSLSVLISDYVGASKIFDRGVMNFPRNWSLNYVAAYHALAEEKDKLKAAKLYYQAFQNGAPRWTSLLAGRLASESGDHDFSRDILQQMKADNFDPIWIKRLEERQVTQ